MLSHWGCGAERDGLLGVAMTFWFRMVLAGFALVRMGEACSCVSDGSPCGPATSETIFAGRVVSAIEHGNVTTYVFDVSESFRGGKSGRVEVTTATQGSMCGYSFVESFEYLVYAGSSGGRLYTSLCNGNQLLRNAAQDLHYIRHFGKRFASVGSLPGYVFGRISNRESDLHPLILEPTWPIPRVHVRARGANGFVANTRTGSDGRYEFFDLPPSGYQLTVLGRGRYHASGPSNVDVQPNSCSYVSFLHTNRAVLRGSLLESDRQPFGHDLALVPIGVDPEPPLGGDANELATYAEDDGNFRFEVPPGRYRLAISPMGGRCGALLPANPGFGREPRYRYRVSIA